MAPSTKIDRLASVALFDGCSRRELERIAAAGDELTMPAGTVLVDQGQTGREAFVIMSGTATATRSGSEIATLGPGDVVGELSLLDHGPRTATVICDTECELLVLDQRQFRELLEEVPTLILTLLSGLSRRIRDLDREYYG